MSKRKRKSSTTTPEAEPADQAAVLIPRSPLTIAMWLVFLGVVIVLITNILPVGGGSQRQARRATRAVSEARQMESEGLWSAAAQRYEAISNNDSVRAKTRAEASARLATIYADQLRAPSKALVALQLAFFYEPDERIKSELGFKIKRFERENGLAPPRGSTDVIARVGDRQVTSKEIIYAWNRLRPGVRPESAEFAKFTKTYMDNVLLVEGARRSGADDSDFFQAEMRLVSQQLLLRAILQPAGAEPDEAALRRYYIQHLADFEMPGAVRAEHIIVLKPGEAEAVGERLASGEAFEAVGADVSLDRDSLPNSVQLGWVEEGEDFIRGVGQVSGLSMSLARLEDGATTGPLKSPRGYHWFRATAHRKPAPRPLEGIEAQVKSALERDTMQARRQALLREFRSMIPYEVFEQKIEAVYNQTNAEPEKKNEIERESEAERESEVGAVAQVEVVPESEPEGAEGKATDAVNDGTENGAEDGVDDGPEAD